MSEASLKTTSKTPAELFRGKLAPVIVVGALGLVAVEGGNMNHDDTPDQSYSVEKGTDSPVTTNVAKAAESHPGQFRGLEVNSKFTTAGSIAEKYAAPGDYNYVVREVTDQQNGAVLGEHQEVFLEKDLLADPNADGLHHLDSGYKQ